MENKENLNRFRTRMDIESVVKNLKTTLVPDGFMSEFHGTIKELIPICPQLFQKVKRKKSLQTHFYKVSMPLLPKPERNVFSHIADEHRCENPKPNTAEHNNTAQRSHIMGK